LASSLAITVLKEHISSITWFTTTDTSQWKQEWRANT